METITKEKNLVIVAGHSGNGKSAIIQHIALKYRREGWLVKPVDTIEEIKEAYVSGNFRENKTVFIFHDPIGKESYNQILYASWKKYEQTLKVFLRSVKLLLTCRPWILSDKRVKGLFEENENIFIADSQDNKLTDDEKMQIFKKNISIADNQEEKVAKVLQIETYFLLLCKLFASNEESLQNVYNFFKEPIDVVEKEIDIWRKKDAHRYCALVCLVLFNNTICLNDMMKNNELFKVCLHLCDLPEFTSPAMVKKTLDSVDGYFIKKIGDTYHFYHDFIMEVTTFVIGTEFPEEMIRYADIGFLRRRLTVGNCSDSNDSFVINVSDMHINSLVERFLKDIVGDRFMEVVLNPSLRNEKIIDQLIDKLTSNPEKVKLLIQNMKIGHTEQAKNAVFNKTFFTKLEVVNLIAEISPLAALISFRHDKLSMFCLKELGCVDRKVQKESIFIAVCCNGSRDMFNMFSKEEVELCLREYLTDEFLIHIVSLFGNYEIIPELLSFGVSINTKIHKFGSTPLFTAVVNDDLERDNQNQLSLREETIITLINNGADVNLCNETGTSPLYKACQYGHDSTVQLLLNNGADVNLCEETGVSPLFIACQNGHDSTVHILLSKGVDVNLCDKTGASPLFIACQNGHDNTVHILLSKGVDVNLCDKTGASPLHIACRNGHESVVHILLCKGIDVNLCDNTGASPLFLACQNGHDSTVHILLSKGVDVNLCDKTGASPLQIAYQNGKDSTMQLLLKNGADLNLCTKTLVNPLK